MADISTAPGILSPEQVQQLVVEPLTRQSVATQVSTVVQTSSTSTRFPIVVADPTSGGPQKVPRSTCPTLTSTS
jgi:hypothetical protein